MNALLTALLTLASLACQAATVAQDVPDDIYVTSNRHDGNHSQLSVVSGGNALVLVVGGEDTTAILNGKPVPEDRLVRDGDRLSVLGQDGEVVFDVRVVDGGGLAYPYDADVIPAYVRARGAYVGFGEAASQLRAYTAGGERRKLIGVTTTSVDGVLALQLGLEPDSAFVINSVSDGRPAELAGMQVSDIVVAVEGESPANTKVLRKHITDREAGDVLRVSVLRGGRPIDLSLTLQEAEGLDYAVSPTAPADFWSTGGGISSFPDVGYITTIVNDAMESQRSELAAVDRQLAEMRDELLQRVEVLRDAREVGEEDALIEAHEIDVKSLREAVERLRDVSAVMSAEALRSAREVSIASTGEGRERTLWLPPAAPRGGFGRDAPAPSPTPGLADRLERLEERMEERMARLEELLERLIESGDGR